MRTTRIALLALLLTGALAGAASASTSVAAGIHIGPSWRAAVDISFFYDDLARYGHWIQRPSYGWVWIPRVTATNWRPYLDGHWVWTDEGWVWVSDEPFGWATYHYGRWYDDATYGWEWIPGDQWAPAWVDWQASNDYVGWAPLPPSYDYARPSRYSLQSDSYVFVPDRYFLSAQVSRYAVPTWESARIYPGTRDYTSYRAYNGSIFNQGLPVTRFQQAIGRPVTRYQVADLGAGQWRQGARIARNRVEVFRPQVQRIREVSPLSRPLARRSVVSASEARALASRHTNRRQMEARQQIQHERQIRQPGPAREMRQQGRAERQVQQHGKAAREIRQQRGQNREIRQHGRAREMRQQGRAERQVQQHGKAAREIRQQRGQNREIRQHGRQAREVRQQSRVDRQVRQHGHANREIRQNSRPDRQMRQQARPNRQVRQQRQAGPQRQMRQQRQAGPQRQVRQQAQRGGGQRQGGGPAHRGHGRP